MKPISKKIESLYLLKAICAFCVVCLHVMFWGRNAVVPVIKTAVPCFYMISGYFLLSNGLDCSFVARAKKQMLKLCKLFVITNVLYVILVLVVLGATLRFQVTSWQDWVQLIFFGHTIVYPLWYVTAYIGALLLLLLIKRFCPCLIEGKKGLALIVVLLLAALFFGRYSRIFGFDFPHDFNRNALVLALPLMLLGHHVKDNEYIINKISNKRMFVITLLMLFLSYAEYALQWRYSSSFGVGELNLMTVPLALCFFVLCVNNKDFGLNKTLVSIGQKDSLYIYLFHIFVFTTLWTLAKDVMQKEYMIMPVVIFLITWLISILIRKVKSLIKS